MENKCIILFCHQLFVQNVNQFKYQRVKSNSRQQRNTWEEPRVAVAALTQRTVFHSSGLLLMVVFSITNKKEILNHPSGGSNEILIHRFWSTIDDKVADDADELGIGHLPIRIDRAMAYPRMPTPEAVLERRIRSRVLQALHALLGQVHSLLEVIVIGHTDSKVQFAL